MILMKLRLIVVFVLNPPSLFSIIDWRARRYPKITLFVSFLFYAAHYLAPNSISNCCCMYIDFLSNQ